MDSLTNQAARGFELFPSGDPFGPSCDALGPSLGPIRLLVKTERGFEPRSPDDLGVIFRATFGGMDTYHHLVSGLQSIAKALDANDMCRAIIATQYLQLPVLNEDQASRARIAERSLWKASPDDPLRPGWPAGTEGGRGGQFRPKDGSGGGVKPEIDQEAAKEARSRRITRQAIRAGLRSILNVRRLLRLGIEGGSNIVPGLDVVADAAMAEELAALAGELQVLARDTRVAQRFAEKGPQELADLQMKDKINQFPSFDAFKKGDIYKHFHPAEEGYEYHHIVEQSAESEKIPAELLNSTKNIIKIPKLLHEEVTAEFARALVKGQGALRNQMKGQSFEKQFEKGLDVLKKFGIVKSSGS